MTVRRELLLAIDVGNTELKLGIFDQEHLLKTWRLRTERDRTADEYVILFSQLLAIEHFSCDMVRKVIVASVVPAVERALGAACRTLFGAPMRAFRPTEQNLMEIRTERASEVGADLIAAALAGRERLGSPVIIITFGTATAFAAVDKDGCYAGVAIAPGIQISLDALIGRAAKLPQIALAAPQVAIGRTTVQAIQSGVLFSVLGQVEGMVARFRKELAEDAPVIASGGFAEIIAEQTAIIDQVAPSLVLEGLALYMRSGDQAE